LFVDIGVYGLNARSGVSRDTDTYINFDVYHYAPVGRNTAYIHYSFYGYRHTNAVANTHPYCNWHANGDNTCEIAHATLCKNTDAETNADTAADTDTANINAKVQAANTNANVDT